VQCACICSVRARFLQSGCFLGVRHECSFQVAGHELRGLVHSQNLSCTLPAPAVGASAGGGGSGSGSGGCHGGGDGGDGESGGETVHLHAGGVRTAPVGLSRGPAPPAPVDTASNEAAGGGAVGGAGGGAGGGAAGGAGAGAGAGADAGAGEATDGAKTLQLHTALTTLVRFVGYTLTAMTQLPIGGGTPDVPDANAAQSTTTTAAAAAGSGSGKSHASGSGRGRRRRYRNSGTLVCTIPQLRFRVTDLPTRLTPTGGTLVYGSADAGRSIHDADPGFRALARALAARLRLRRHVVGHGEQRRELHTCADLEGHRGTDGRCRACPPAHLPTCPPAHLPANIPTSLPPLSPSYSLYCSLLIWLNQPTPCLPPNRPS
jgi:hypothetical protein